MVTDMALFHMSFSNISAGKGRSAIASAAYRSGKKAIRSKEGRSLLFMPAAVMPESFILTPKNAPEWASDRERLWNEAEEKTAEQIHAMQKSLTALPVELSEDEQKELLTNMYKKILLMRVWLPT